MNCMGECGMQTASFPPGEDGEVEPWQGGSAFCLRDSATLSHAFFDPFIKARGDIPILYLEVVLLQSRIYEIILRRPGVVQCTST